MEAMKRRCIGFAICGFLIAAGWTPTRAQEQHVGLFINDERAYEGYTLVVPLFYDTAYLVDNDGLLVQMWSFDTPTAGATYLLPNGNILRGGLTPNANINFGGLGGIVQEVAWDGSIVWEFEYSDDQHALHHDVAYLPNGNILMVAWEHHSAEDAIANGRDPDTLPSGAFWPEQVIEVRPTPPEGGEIVWKWHVWDHLIQDLDPSKANYGVVEDHPGLIDINYAPARQSDWLHVNAINYNAERDEVVLSVPGFNELWVIDHSTTTAEAAGHTGGRHGRGGDLIYRWGNPEAYRAGTAADRQVQFLHDVQWVEPGLPGAGNILLFDNGLNRQTSAIIELVPPLDDDGFYEQNADGVFGFGDVEWRYENPGTFFSGFASGEQRQPNGNTLIAEAETGRIFEVTTGGDIVWEYVNPVTDEGPLARDEPIPAINERGWLANSVFRAYRYPLDYAGLEGKDLTPFGPIELPTDIEEDLAIPTTFALAQNYPNPFNPTTTIPFHVPQRSRVTLAVYNGLGQRIATLTDREYSPGAHTVTFEAAGLPSGVYFYRLEAEGTTRALPMTLLE